MPLPADATIVGTARTVIRRKAMKTPRVDIVVQDGNESNPIGTVSPPQCDIPIRQACKEVINFWKVWLINPKCANARNDCSDMFLDFLEEQGWTVSSDCTSSSEAEVDLSRTGKNSIKTME